MRELKIVNVSSIIIPNDVAISRQEASKEGIGVDDYVNKYDYKTLFYDVFNTPEGVCLLAPSLLNLKDFIQHSEWSSGKGKSNIDMGGGGFSSL